MYSGPPVHSGRAFQFGCMKAAILIDGGYLRVLARKAGFDYDPELIERTALACLDSEAEKLHRILYYDCAPYMGKQKLPVTGEETVWEGSDQWLRVLASKDYFAVRRGVIKFRGFRLRKIPYQPERALVDGDFEAVFEQKGVDMRLGLDIATLSEKRIVERIVLLSGDTDCVPAMKHARKAGLQVVIVQLPKTRLAAELVIHSDLTRLVAWPEPLR